MRPIRLPALFDDGLDELAASAHAGFWPRLAATAAAGGLFSFVISWRLSLAWTCVALVLEGQAWLATRHQFLGRPVGWRRRLWHAAGLAVAAQLWVALGAAGWMSGTLDGAICAVVVWFSVIFFAQVNAYQSPLGSAIGGALPAISVMSVVLLAPHVPHLRLGPVAALMLVGLAFAADGAGRMIKARRRLAETQARMRRTDALYRVLADNVSDVITLSDEAGKRLYMSPSIERALGYPLDQLQAMPIFGFIHPDDREALARQVAELQRSGGELTAEYRVVRADGSALWVETSFTMAPGDGDGPRHLVSVARIAQRRKELEAQLIEARSAAEAAAAAKSDFLANMTHELRTPLNAIIGFTGVLRNAPGLNGQDARHVRLIDDAGRTLLELVNSVLDFSRLEAGAVELDDAPFDPAAEAAAIVDLMSGQAGAKGLTLDLRVEGSGLVSGDARRLRQVLLNFVSNAIKFTAQGGVTLALVLSREGERASLRAEVADTGVGIADGQIAHVFERFTQADVSVSRRYGGTGLGLAICKRTIELMGGQIGARSVEGAGSTFWFEVSLPIAETLAAPTESDAPAALERPVRLLLVEDAAINRELVKTVLAPFDIEIDEAEDGLQAIAAFGLRDYDLVLMDVQMPGMDGLTATRRIRASATPRAAATPIVAMTANVLPEQIARCLEAGMDDHIGKPMNPADLLSAIAHWSSNARPVALFEAAAG
jgi:PAS domain S-box-containing protein